MQSKQKDYSNKNSMQEEKPKFGNIDAETIDYEIIKDDKKEES